MEVLKSIINWELYHEVINKGKKPKIDTEYNIYKTNLLGEFNFIKNESPINDRDIIGFDIEGNKYYCYLHYFDEDETPKWVNSYNLKILDVDIILWKYDETYLWV
jgi:hypothetical protein